MKKSICQLTELDVTRLEKHTEHDPRFRKMLDTLLERADIVQPNTINANIVTMNSTVTLVDESNTDSTTWTIVYPDQANLDQGKLNVFSPVGMALLGIQQGESINITLPHGTARVMKVSKIVFQPEANGDYMR